MKQKTPFIIISSTISHLLYVCDVAKKKTLFKKNICKFFGITANILYFKKFSIQIVSSTTNAAYKAYYTYLLLYDSFLLNVKFVLVVTCNASSYHKIQMKDYIYFQVWVNLELIVITCNSQQYIMNIPLEMSSTKGTKKYREPVIVWYFGWYNDAQNFTDVLSSFFQIPD